MIIFVIVIELMMCLLAYVAIAFGTQDGDQAAFPLQVWLACAIVQLAIHYLRPGRNIAYGLLCFVMLILFVGVTSGRSEPFPYIHQALFIAGVAAIPQLWWERFAKTTKDRGPVLLLIGLVALPLGFAAWSLANIWIVKFEAWRAADGEPYCILPVGGNLVSSEHHQTTIDWGLSGWNMASGPSGGGSGNCCVWQFHGLLQTHKNKLFNWSYKSQRFESVSDRTRSTMRLNVPNCQ
jgi:hypothetical protein